MDLEGLFSYALYGSDVGYTRKKRMVLFPFWLFRLQENLYCPGGSREDHFYFPLLNVRLQENAFRFCNALDIFQRYMMFTFSDIEQDTIKVFMGDFLVVGDFFCWCFMHLAEVLKRCNDCNFVLNWENVTLW